MARTHRPTAWYGCPEGHMALVDFAVLPAPRTCPCGATLTNRHPLDDLRPSRRAGWHIVTYLYLADPHLSLAAAANRALAHPTTPHGAGASWALRTLRRDLGIHRLLAVRQARTAFRPPGPTLCTCTGYRLPAVSPAGECTACRRRRIAADHDLADLLQA